MATVISPNFCRREEVHLTIVRKAAAVTDGNFVITDHKGNIVFKVIDKLFTVHNRHELVDAGGNPIVTFKKKHLSVHKRWKVFNGDDSLVFSTRNSSIIQFKTELEVFLSDNRDEDSWDFKVVGSWLNRSCVVYAKDWTPIAEIHKKHTFGSVVLGKDNFHVTVHPQVDYAFIAALVVILYEITKDKDD